MSVTDPLADAFVKIKNGYGSNKDHVDIKSSKLLLKITDILKARGFIKDYKKIEDSKQGIIRVYLKYLNKNKPALNKIDRVSKPGCRIYAKKDNIPQVLNGMGIAILTTSGGIMSDYDARRNKLGGEVICYVY
ncbi:MAG: 30S ribosomal protein S8 [Candidatus Omnitrophica bacterium]|nr:30S ribosomal protein S8 [Candidatus Omnitrophota bacterium]